MIVQNLSASVPQLSSTGTIIGFNRETTIAQANAITAIIQASLTQGWYNAANSSPRHGLSSVKEYRYAQEYISSTSTMSPEVNVRCALAQNISTDVFSVNFPVKTWALRDLGPSDEGSPKWYEGAMPFNISTSDPKYSKELHFHWVELPTDRFGPVSGGIYLQLPWNPATKSQAVIGCSISATWVYADVASNSISSDAAWSLTSTNADAVGPEIMMGLDASFAQARDYHRLITLKERWYRFLTPSMPSDGSKNESHSYKSLQQLSSDVDIATDLVAQRTQPRPRWDEPTNSCIVKPPGASITDVDRLNSRDCGLGGKC